MEINYIAILLATVAQFIVGAIWYMPIFGKLWGKMHGFETLSKADQAEAQKGMMPYLALQFATTFVTSFVFALLVTGLPSEWNMFGIAGFFWIGFVVPTQISAVVFGGTEKRWMVKKIGIMAGASFICFMTLATVMNFF